MTNDEDTGQCVCCLGIIALYLISLAIGEFGWKPIVGIIAAIIVTIVACQKIWDEAHSLTEKGKAYIKFGIAWFILIFVITLFIDLWIIPSYSRERGMYIFLLTLFLNLPGTLVLFKTGAKNLESCEEESRISEGRKIYNYGGFWFFFWLFYAFIIRQYNDVDYFFLFLAMFGGIANIIIGRRLSNVTEGKLVIEPITSAKEYPSTYPIINIPEHAMCPFCSLNIRNSRTKYGGVISCPQCGALHHKQCFESGGCGNPACR